jgi:5-methylcytosine-specific restriction endonuclease McrA
VSYNEVRRPYEFDNETRQEALRLSNRTCEACGKPETQDETFHHHFDHIIPISFAIKYPVFALPLIKSLQNCRVLCPECHRKRNHYDSTEILSLVPVVVTRFVEAERLKNANPTR